jgi:hypothetical protein
MENEKTLALAPANNYKSLEIQEIKDIAGAMVGAGMFPDLTSANTAFIKILAGQEMGVAPFQAVSGIHVIQGRASLSANLMAAKVKGSGKYDYRVSEQSETRCTIDFFQREEGKWVHIGSSLFTIEMARKAGTKNLDKFPQNMLFARAMSNGVKMYTPDVFGMPVYTEDEIETEINGERSAVMPETVNPDATPAKPARAKPPTKPSAKKTDEVVEEAAPVSDEVTTEPVETEADLTQEPMVTELQRRKIFALLKEKGIGEDIRKDVVKGLTGIDSTGKLTQKQANTLIEQLDAGEKEGILLTAGVTTNPGSEEEVPF